MNKQEAIEKLQGMKQLIEEGDKGSYERGFINALTYALNITKQLEEPVKPPEPKPLKPEKPVVPQFVADWYEENKDGFEYNLYRLCIDFYEQKLHEDLHEWFNHDKNKPIEVLVLMNKYGYEVEQEKLYTVEIPNPNGDGYNKTFLGKIKDDKVELCKWSCYTSIEFADNWKQEEYAQLTETEIKQDFEWAWKFAEEVKE